MNEKYKNCYLLTSFHLNNIKFIFHKNGFKLTGQIIIANHDLVAEINLIYFIV